MSYNIIKRLVQKCDNKKNKGQSSSVTTIYDYFKFCSIFKSHTTNIDNRN